MRRINRIPEMWPFVLMSLILTGCTSEPLVHKDDSRPKLAYPKLNLGDQDRNKRIAELMPHFDTKEDEFNKTTSYMHKTFSRYMNGNGTTLVAEINVIQDLKEDPSFYLESEYVGEDWIFHEEVTVKVGEILLSVSNNNPRRETTHGGVVEFLMVSGQKAVPIAELIAKAGSQPVRVRLSGNHVQDFTLKTSHQKAIAETFELWRLFGGNSRLW